MNRGAIEFLTKRVRDQDLPNAIQLAIAQDHARRNLSNRLPSLRTCFRPRRRA